jgi:hypothetical protein
MLSLQLGNHLVVTSELRMQLRQCMKLHFYDPCVTATKGLEGMRVADAVLKDYDVPGVLVGGLASAIWNRRSTPDTLAQHKDVDVAVLAPAGIRPLEAGVDWWMPKTTHVHVQTDYSKIDEDVTYWQNVNHVILRYTLNTQRELEPGLHIMERASVLQMLVAERTSTIDDAVHIAGVEDALDARFDRTTGRCMPKFLRSVFPTIDWGLQIYEQPHNVYAVLD